MNYNDYSEAIKDAKRTLNSADEVVRQTGCLMIGRLNKMSPFHLAKLKKELQDFNAKTGTWKN
jgi:hypothetical protein